MGRAWQDKKLDLDRVPYHVTGSGVEIVVSEPGRFRQGAQRGVQGGRADTNDKHVANRRFSYCQSNE